MNIYEAITSIISEVGAIGKDKENTQQGFMYRGIDDVMNTLQPLFAKYKVFIVPEVLEQIREDRLSNKGNALIYSICKMKYTFYAEDGSNIVAVVVGEGMDSGDKATNKAMAIAMKYACFQVFCIPTEEMKDPDSECHEVKPKNEPKAKNESKPEPKKPELKKPESDKPEQKQDKPTVQQLKDLMIIAQDKKVSLKEFGQKVTGKKSSTQWTLEDFNKVCKELEAVE